MGSPPLAAGDVFTGERTREIIFLFDPSGFSEIFTTIEENAS
jgi:hypothetical protein